MHVSTSVNSCPILSSNQSRAALGHDKAQNIIDQITSAYESGGPPPGGFGFGPQHLGGPPPGFGAPPMGYGGQPMPPPGFGGRKYTLSFACQNTFLTMFFT
jgi:hypothetical protein